MSSLLEAAKWTARNPEPHQAAAWNQLDGQLTADQREDFLETFRAAPAPKPPLKDTAPKPRPMDDLLALIRKGEGGWDSVNRGTAGDTPGGWTGLVSMTLGEVMEAQSMGKVFAVGAYQFIPDTLAEVVKRSGEPETATFDPDLQNRLASELILGGWKRQGLSRYLISEWLDTEGNLSKAQNELAYEWASIPNSEGRGQYDGDAAGNRAHGDVEEVRQVLRHTREALAGWPPLVPPPEAPPPKNDPFDRLADGGEPTYYTQRDNGAHADRSCFSSACAMLAERVKPGCLGPGKNADFDYLDRVLRHGDTIHAWAQVAALAELGIKARLVKNAGQGLIDQQLLRWGGLAVGYIHRGAHRRPGRQQRRSLGILLVS